MYLKETKEDLEKTILKNHENWLIRGKMKQLKLRNLEYLRGVEYLFEFSVCNFQDETLRRKHCFFELLLFFFGIRIALFDSIGKIVFDVQDDVLENREALRGLYVFLNWHPFGLLDLLLCSVDFEGSWLENGNEIHVPLGHSRDWDFPHSSETQKLRIDSCFFFDLNWLKLESHPVTLCLLGLEDIKNSTIKGLTSRTAAFSSVSKGSTRPPGIFQNP